MKKSENGPTGMCLEVFELRVALNNIETVAQRMEEFKSNFTTNRSWPVITVYQHKELSSDWCVHIHYPDKEGYSNSSELRSRIKLFLEDLGSLYHSIWQELCYS